MPETIEAPIATGELIDKITILEIKSARVHDAPKLANIATELTLLCQRRDASLSPSPALDQLTARLKAVNELLWDLEDRIRDCERRKEFGPDFVDIARGIYRANDQRASIKREISLACGSKLIEEKSYAAE